MHHQMKPGTNLTDNLIFIANAIIVFTKGRSTVDYASTTAISNIIVRDYSKCYIRELSEVIEQWFIPAKHTSFIISIHLKKNIPLT